MAIPYIKDFMTFPNIQINNKKKTTIWFYAIRPKTNQTISNLFVKSK